MQQDDIHYARERHAPFTPPKETSLLLIVGIWLAMAALAFQAISWWQDSKRQERTQHAASIQPRRLAETTTLPAASPPFASEVLRSLPQPREQIHPQPAQQRPAVTAPFERPSTGNGTLYHCKAADGRTFWAQAACSQHHAMLDRMTTVPTDLSFEQQVEIAEHRRQALMVPSSPPAASIVAQTFSAPNADKAECKLLDARVQELDALARQPQSAATQDWIRSERKKARDRQFELRC